MNRPVIEWVSDQPPSPGEKVIALSRYGVLILGQVTRYEWDSGHIICWQHCPKKPENWDELLLSAQSRQK